MAYRVSLTAPAESDAYAAFERIREAAPDTRGKVAHGLIQGYSQPGDSCGPMPSHPFNIAETHFIVAPVAKLKRRKQ
jgi:hypothetical protein